MSKVVVIFVAAVASAAVLFTVGCESDAQTGALIGSGAGAGVGALAGRSTESTLIGAAVGGGAGYMLGNEGDKKKESARTNAEIANLRADQDYVTVWVVNSNGSRVPVRLKRSGPNYIGPNGEYYDKLPGPEELKPVYGF